MKVSKESKPITEKKFDLNSLKKYKEDQSLNGVKDKDLEWIPLHPSFYDAVKSPGVPKGYYSIFRGDPNVGKSTIKYDLISSCQKLNILPIIRETENNFSWDHARECGMEFEDIYGDVVNEDTGEVESKIIDHNGFFIFMDSSMIFKKYGKWDWKAGKELSKPNRDVACIEDAGALVNDLLNQQMKGELPLEFCFIWDSIGSLPAYESAISLRNNNLWAGGAMENAFSQIFANRIPMSRKEGRPYTNTFVAIQKIRRETMMSGAVNALGKGGKVNDYNARFVVHLGGIATSGIKFLTATSKGKDFRFGIKVPIKVIKNHVTDVTGEGEICSLSTGLYWADSAKLEKWKKEHLKEILKKLDLEDGDVDIVEVETE